MRQIWDEVEEVGGLSLERSTSVKPPASHLCRPDPSRHAYRRLLGAPAKS